MTADLNIALGAMEFGTRIDEATSFVLLDQFVDGGGVWIDTADCYAFWLSHSGTGGDSEALIGRWLAQRPGMRERVKIATKAGCEPLHDGAPGATTGLSHFAIDTQFEASLRRLGLDSVDLFFAHRDDREVPVEEVAETLGRHAAEGRIGRVGLSNWPVWRADRARAHAESQGLPAADTSSCGTPTSSRARWCATAATTTGWAGSPTRRSTTSRQTRSGRPGHTAR